MRLVLLPVGDCRDSSPDFEDIWQELRKISATEQNLSWLGGKGRESLCKEEISFLHDRRLVCGERGVLQLP